MKRTAELTLIFIIMLLKSNTANAYEFLHTSDGSTLRWNDNTVQYYVNVDGFKDFDASQISELVQRATEEWTTQGFGLKFEYMGLTHVKAAKDDDMNVLYFEQSASNWSAIFPGQENALAMTRNWALSSGDIQGFDLVFNDARHLFTSSDEAALSSADFQNTVTHELGHVLGLDHSSVDEATMYYSSQQGEISKRDLDVDDVAGVRALYSDGFVDEQTMAPFACSMNPKKSDVPNSALLIGLSSLVLLAFRRRASS